jgi:hypothetical protein
VPLPDGVTTIVLTGTYLTPAGDPVLVREGCPAQVTFTPNTVITDGTGKVIFSTRPVIALLNAEGQFSITLACTDNADLNPAGWVWNVNEEIPDLGRSYSILLPSTLGETADISDLSPVASVPPASSYVLSSQVGEPSGVASLDSSGLVPEGEIPDLSGTYLSLAGGTVTGPIGLPGNPAGTLQAAPKQYVDAETARAESAEDALGVSISAETSRAESAESALVPLSDLPLQVGHGGTGAESAAAGLAALGGAAVAGDLGGTSASPVVAKIQGTVISPPPGGTAEYLRGDGDWGTPPGSGITLAGDLGGTEGSPEVVSTHLGSPLPVAQGGTNSGTQNWTGLLTPTTQTGTYTANPGDLVKADVSSASWTMKLPSAPAANVIAGAKIMANATGNTNTLTVACQGSDVFEQSGGATTTSLFLLNQAAAWQYSAGYWTRLSDDLPLSQLDQRYVLIAPAPSGDATGATDTANLQALINGAGSTSTMRALRISLAPGNYVIDTTLTAEKKSVELAGAGWGAVSGGTGIGTTITWAGSAGIPMLRFWACYGIKVSRIKFYGLSAAEPSAAISMYNLSSDSNGNSFNLIEQCWFGSYEGFDGSGNPNPVSCGVLFEGSNVNDDQTTISGCVFYGLPTGVQYSNTQNVINKIEHCYFYGCGVNVNTAASIALDHTFMALATVQDLNISNAAAVTCTNFSAEGSAQLAYLRGGSQLFVRSGYWQVGNNLAGSSGSAAYVVDALANSTQAVKFEDYRFTFAAYTNPASPQIAMGQVSSGAGTVQLTLENCQGITDVSPSVTGVYPFLQSGGNTSCHLLLEGSVILSAAVQTRQRFRIALDDVTVGYTHPVPISFSTYDIPGAGNTLSAYLAPAVVTLTDASTVAVNAALGNDLRLTFTSATGSTRTIGAPSNPVNGQDLTFALTQASSGGPYTVTWASGAGGYSFGAANAPILSATASDVDLIAFKYIAALQLWCSLGSSLGF